MPPAQISIASTEREATDPGVVYGAADRSESILGSFDVDIFPDSPASYFDSLLRFINSDLPHLPQIDDESIIDRA